MADRRTILARVEGAALAVGVLVAIGIWIANRGGTESETHVRPAPVETSERSPSERPAVVGDAPGAPSPAVPPTKSPLVLTGRVESPAGEPIAGARVDVTASRGEAFVELGRAISGDGGAFSLDIAALRALADPAPDVEFFATARADRFRETRDPVPLGMATWPIETSVAAVRPIVLSPGAAVRGRVLDADGAPVEDARVALAESGGDVLAASASDRLGEFEVPIDVRGEGRVRLEKAGVGAMTVGPIAFSPDADVLLGDVRLAGGTTLAGIVVYPDGAPVGAIDVLVRNDSLPADEERDARLEAASAAGLLFARGETGDDGRFSFRGLAPGAYACELPDLRLDGAPAFRFTFDAGVTDARVTIDWHRLRVRVLMPNGDPVEGQQVMAVGWTREHEERCHAAAASGEGPEAFFDHADFGRGVSGGEFEAFVPRGSFVFLRGQTFGGGPDTAGLVVDRTWEAPFDANETALDLTLESVPLGRLRLAMREESGRAVTGAVATLRSKSGYEYAFIRDEPDEDGYLPAAKPGEYRLEVEPGTPLVEHFLPIETDVVVVAGQDTTVPLVAKLGGRLRLTVTVPSDSTGAFPEVEVGPRGGAEPVRERAFFQRLDDGRITWSTGLGANEPWLVGSPLAVGAFRVRVKATGFADAESEFAIEAGRTTDVTLELKRR